jgi:hypothetical protein
VQYKPEAAAAASSSGSGGGKSNITAQMQMTVEEAHLILNVKKDEPMEVIQQVSVSGRFVCPLAGAIPWIADCFSFLVSD